MSVNIEKIWELFEIAKAEAVMDLNTEKEKCCNDFYPITDQGYQACVNCGMVCETSVVDSDIFTFENGENNKYLRQYDNFLFPKSSTSTKIYGNSRMARIQNWDSMPYNERVLWEVSTTLKKLLNDIFSSRIINDSLILYKKFYETSGIYRGENKKGFVAVCVYIAASQNFASTTPKVLSSIFEIELKIFYKCQQKYSEITGSNSDSVSGVKYVDPFLNRLELPYKLKKPVVKIIEYIESTCIVGSPVPQNICISTILFVSREMGIQLDIQQISEDFSVSMTTLDKILSVLVKNKQRIFKNLKK